jgi:hypothetical protein
MAELEALGFVPRDGGRYRIAHATANAFCVEWGPGLDERSSLGPRHRTLHGGGPGPCPAAPPNPDAG